MKALFDSLDKNFTEMVMIRRHLHENPELSFEEVHTPAYIADYHRKLGHEVRTEVGGRGVVAVLHGRNPGATVALRADFDALAIQEENEVSYKSKVKGVMHACGHDGHTASMLVLAKALNKIKDELSGSIVFIHQHAEEISPGGAIAMIEDGCLNGVDVIFGNHLWATSPYGTLLTRSGPIMAAADAFDVTFKGKGGHGAEPHETKDSVVIGSQFVINAQQIVSRRVKPLYPSVVSIGHFEALNPFNVIADSAFLKGTVRTFDEEARELIERELDRVAKATVLACDAEYEFIYKRGYPPVCNHPVETDLILEVAKSIQEVHHTEICEPFMGGEDFGYYLQHVKGAFFFTGAQNPSWETTYPHHHPKFDIDERSMLVAAKILGSAAITYINKELDRTKKFEQN